MIELVHAPKQATVSAEVIPAPDRRVEVVEDVLNNECVYLNDRGRIVPKAARPGHQRPPGQERIGLGPFDLAHCGDIRPCPRATYFARMEPGGLFVRLDLELQ